MNPVRARFVLALLAAFAAPACAGGQPASAEMSHVLPFEIGGHGFLVGDSIQISELRGDREKLEVGGRYVVRGTYTLGSTGAATLGVFLTYGEVDGPSSIRAQRGSAPFEIVFKIFRLGYPHVSFYPFPSGEAFGGSYFGHGDQRLDDAGWYQRLDGQTKPPPKGPASKGPPNKKAPPPR